MPGAPEHRHPLAVTQVAVLRRFRDEPPPPLTGEGFTV